jgi:hypothetical protein
LLQLPPLLQPARGGRRSGELLQTPHAQLGGA